MKAGTSRRSSRSLRALILLGVFLAGVLVPARGAAGPTGRVLKKAAEILIIGAAALRLARPHAEPEAQPDPVAQAFEGCMHDLTAVSLNDQRDSAYRVALGYLKRSYRLDEPDAADIVASVLIDVCESHTGNPLPSRRLFATFFRSVKNRAIDQWRVRRSFLRCQGELQYELQTCGVAELQDEQVRMSGEVDAARRHFCQLPVTAQAIIMRHAIAGETFEEVGKELGLTADQARTQYHNALRRVRARLQAECAIPDQDDE